MFSNKILASLFATESSYPMAATQLLLAIIYVYRQITMRKSYKNLWNIYENRRKSEFPVCFLNGSLRRFQVNPIRVRVQNSNHFILPTPIALTNV